jgi:hypothetical protein
MPGLPLSTVDAVGDTWLQRPSRVALSSLALERGGSRQTTQEAADMTAIVLPDIDRRTLDELKKRIPDLSEIELPNLPSKKEVSRTADQAIDRLLGRSRTPIWAWIAAAIAFAAVVGVVAAWFAWFRRPTGESRSEPWTDQLAEEPSIGGTEPDSRPVDDSWPTTKTADSFETSIETEPVGTAVPVMRSAVGARGGSHRSSASSLTRDDAISPGTPPYPIEEA